MFSVCISSVAGFRCHCHRTLRLGWDASAGGGDRVLQCHRVDFATRHAAINDLTVLAGCIDFRPNGEDRRGAACKRKSLDELTAVDKFQFLFPKSFPANPETVAWRLVAVLFAKSPTLFAVPEIARLADLVNEACS